MVRILIQSLSESAFEYEMCSMNVDPKLSAFLFCHVEYDTVVLNAVIFMPTVAWQQLPNPEGYLLVLK